MVVVVEVLSLHPWTSAERSRQNIRLGRGSEFMAMARAIAASLIIHRARARRRHAMVITHPFASPPRVAHTPASYPKLGEP